MANTKLVAVFDLDGTLAETAVYWLPVLEEFQKEVSRQYGISSQVQPLSAPLRLLGTSERYLLGQMYPGRSEHDYAHFQQLAREVWEPLVEQHPFKLYEGVEEVLAHLAQHNWWIMLASNCDNWYMEKMLNQTLLGKYVHATACAEQHPGKEKWQFTQEMLRKRVFLYAGYMVGDSCSDMKAGRASGLTTVYANYGYAQCGDEASKDFVIEDVKEFVEVMMGRRAQRR